MNYLKSSWRIQSFTCHRSDKNQGVMIEVKLNGTTIDIDVDSGTAVTVPTWINIIESKLKSQKLSKCYRITMEIEFRRLELLTYQSSMKNKKKCCLRLSYQWHRKENMKPLWTRLATPPFVNLVRNFHDELVKYSFEMFSEDLEKHIGSQAHIENFPNCDKG